jgi:hypothetical protein
LFYELISDVVGPAEPTLLLTTTRLSLDTNISKHYYLEVKPKISFRSILSHGIDLSINERYSIEFRPNHLLQLILSKKGGKFEDINFDLLLLNNRKLLMDLSHKTLTEKELFSIAEFMCDFADLLEREY